MFIKLEWIRMFIAFVLGFMTCAIVSHLGLYGMIAVTLLSIIASGYIRSWCREAKAGRVFSMVLEAKVWVMQLIRGSLKK